MRTPTAFGIELDGDRLRVVRGRRVGGRFTWSVVSLDDPGAADFRSGRTAVSGHLDAKGSLTRWLDVPYASAGKAVQVLPTLLDIQLPFPLEQCVFGFLSRERTDGGTRALAVAARLTEIQQRIDAYQARNLNPTHLDHEGLALWSQALEDCPPGGGDAERLRVLLHMTDSRWTVVLGRGRRYLAAHGVTPGDEGQVRRLVHAHLADAGPEVVWLWSGAGAGDAAAVESLHCRLSARIPGPSRILDRPDTVLARSLARRIVMPDGLACNLRGGPLLHERVRARQARAARRPGVLLAAGGVLLCAAVLFADLAAGQKEAEVDRRFRALAESLARHRVAAKGRDAVRIVEAALRQRERDANPILEVAGPSHIAALVRIAAAARRHGLDIETVELSRGIMRISGSSPDWDAPAAFHDTIQAEHAGLALQRKEDLRRSRVSFSLAAAREEDTR